MGTNCCNNTDLLKTNNTEEFFNAWSYMMENLESDISKLSPKSKQIRKLGDSILNFSKDLYNILIKVPEFRLRSISMETLKQSILNYFLYYYHYCENYEMTEESQLLYDNYLQADAFMKNVKRKFSIFNN